MTQNVAVYHHKQRWYHAFMPTSRRRFQVTETEDVARALNEAAKQWPNEPRSRLIIRTITTGGETLARANASKAKLTRLRQLQGSYEDAYGPDYLTNLRADWPA